MWKEAVHNVICIDLHAALLTFSGRRDIHNSEISAADQRMEENHYLFVSLQIHFITAAQRSS
jgi:hypothetical protein